MEFDFSDHLHGVAEKVKTIMKTYLPCSRAREETRLVADSQYTEG